MKITAPCSKNGNPYFGEDEALARVLLSLAKDKPLRQQIGTKGRIKAGEYSWRNTAQKVMDYYVTLLSKS